MVSPSAMPLMSRLTAVMTQRINEDSATDVTPASGEAERLAGLLRPRSRGHDAGRETADPCSGLLRSEDAFRVEHTHNRHRKFCCSGPFVYCMQAPVG